MAYKILTKNGIDNSNIDGARGEYFNSGMRDGIVQGVLNEGTFISNASNSISFDSCELRIAGHRIVIDEPVYHTFTNAPSSDTRYAFVAQIVVDDNQNVEFSLFVQTASTQLIQNDLYKNITGAGTYQVEIGRFTLLTTLTIEDIVRTIDVITGGTGGGSGSEINIGTVTTQTLDSDADAEVDVSSRYEEDEGKEYLDFTFGIPKAEVNVDDELSETSENAVQNKAITNAIIRRDAAQTLTDAEKQQAQTNTTHTATQNHSNSGVQPGWYQVANLKTQGNYDIKIKQSYNFNFPEAIHLSISINNRLYTGSPFASITQLSGVKPEAYSLTKIRVRQGTDASITFLDVYNPDQLWNTTWVDITSDSQDVVVETNSPFQFIGTEDNPSGYKISSLDLVTGFNTNSSLNVENTLTVNNIADTNGNYTITPSQIANRSGKYSTLKSGGSVIVDTRSVNSPPSYYANQETCYEFKSTEVLGLTELMPSAYVTLKSVKGWTGDNYTVYQEAVCAGNDLSALDSGLVCYRYGVEDTWGEWQIVSTEIPYEYTKKVSFGASGYLYIGKFPVYDTNITVDISCTTSTTYNGKLVVACQNSKIMKASVFGDYSNIVTANIFLKLIDNTVEVYFKPQAWSKNIIHITCCGIQGNVTYICEKIDAVPTDATLQPVNEFLEVQPQTVVIYNMDSEDENVNRGFTSGMKGTNYIQLDFSQYKSIRIYARVYSSNCVQEIPVKNRKLTDITFFGAGSNPIILSILKVLFTIEPSLNRLQIGAYAKYTFSSATGTFTLESGASNDNFYVYRIEGIR